MSRRAGLALGACLLAAALIYLPGLALPRFGDDLGFLVPDPSRPLFHFTAPHPHHHFYRPIEAAILALFQQHFAASTGPLHLLLIVGHGLLGWLIWLTARELGLSDREAAAAAGYGLLCQVAVLAVASNDTLSQVLASLFTMLALASFDRHLTRARGGWLAASLVALAVALWSKESSAGALPALALLVVLRRRHLRGRAAVAAGLGLVAAAALLGLYLAARAPVTWLRPGFGEGGYSFRAGANVVANLAALVGATVLPVNTVTVVEAGWARQWPVIAAGAGLAVLVLGAVVAGWAAPERRRLGLALAGLYLACVSPLVMLNHVSELHAYAGLPLLALLAGPGLRRTLDRLPGRWGGALLLVLALSHLTAVESKLARMRDNGRRAATLAAQVVPLARALPPGGRLILVHQPGDRHRYSVFVLPDLEVLVHGEGGLQVLTGRRDVAIRIVEPHEVAEQQPTPADQVLTLVGDAVVPWPGPPGGVP